MKPYRNGDLLIVEVPFCPQGALLDHRILAHGEATGHAHRVDPINLPQGHYRVMQRREYTASATRYVEN